MVSYVVALRDLVYCCSEDGILVHQLPIIGDSRDNCIWSTMWLSMKPVVVKLIVVICSERGDQRGDLYPALVLVLEIDAEEEVHHLEFVEVFTSL